MNTSAIFKAAHKYAKHQVENNREFDVKGGYRKALSLGLKLEFAKAKKAKLAASFDLEAIAAKVKSIDGRVSAYVDGNAIKGCFRGKSSEGYTWVAGSFIYNNAGHSVSSIFAKAI